MTAVMQNENYENVVNALKSQNWIANGDHISMSIGRFHEVQSFGYTTNGGGRKKGRCKWFNVAKGWGFITPNDGTQDVFVHQSVVHKGGFRSLADGEEVEFEYKPSAQGLEATLVCGPNGTECRGSDRRPLSRKKFRKIRCYNCGDFGNHIAAKCPHGPLPKRCHNCKSTEHLIADCPIRDPGKKPPRNGNNNDGNSGLGNGHVGASGSSVLRTL